MRKVKLYYVIKDEDILCTITSKPEHAWEYVGKILKIDCYNHFKPWCDLKSLDAKDPASWSTYLRIVKPSNPYKVKVLKYSASELAELLRVYNGCLAIGASYESSVERNLSLNYISLKLGKNKTENA